MLFAAGRGTRLRPLSERIPKAVLPIIDIPLGAFGLDRLLASCGRVFANVDASVQALVGAGLHAPATHSLVTFLEESPDPFGTAGTLAANRGAWGERIVTWNADTISSLQVDDLLKTHRSIGAPLTIAVTRVTEGADFTYEGARVTSFIDRRVRTGAAGGRFLGVAVLERAVLDLIPRQRPLGLAEGVLEPLSRTRAVAVHEHAGYAIDVGTFPRYLEASLDQLEKRGPRPPRDPPGEIVAVEGGTVYLGPGTTAAAGTLGAGAILLQGAHVQTGAFVERAVVVPGAVVPAGALVRDQVWL